MSVFMLLPPKSIPIISGEGSGARELKISTKSFSETQIGLYNIKIHAKLNLILLYN